jgi:hypothetical protein
VTELADGGFRIGDARAPGCEVIVRHTKAEYRAVRETKTHELAAIGGGYLQLVALEAKYGKDSQARLELDNAEIVEGDLRGACGKTVVTKVFDGHGSRRLFAASEKEVRGGLGGPVKLAPQLQTSGQALDELTWKDDQAYAFEVKTVAPDASEAPSVDVQLPSIVTEGEEVVVTFESARPAWLVVYYVDADGKAEVLWPSNEEPSPEVRAGERATLPSSAERAAGIRIRGTLSKPGVAAREQLVVYAFSDQRDFDLFKPPSGSTGEGIAFTEELARRLRHIPASRWSRKVVGYRIVPKSSK